MIDLIGKFLTKSYFYNPVFVVGASRSGTSVLLQALGKHPLIISMWGESPFITSMGGAVYLFEFASNKDYYIRSLRVSKDYLYDFLRRLTFEVAAGRNYGLKMVMKDVIRCNISFLGKRFWCAKTFPDDRVAQSLIRLYPQAKFIYIIRNGCNVVHSMMKFAGFRQQEFSENCRAWASSEEKYRYLLESKSAIVVRHEQLVEKPEEVFLRIFTFIGVSYNDNPVNFIKNVLVHPLENPTKKGIDVKNVLRQRKPPYDDWSPEQRELFKKTCGNSMVNLGYTIPF